MSRVDAPLCHINLARGFRGGERQTQLLITALATRGWQQRLIARKDQPLAQRCAGLKGLQVVEVPSNHIAAARAMRGARLVHVHDGRSVYSAWLAHAFASIPYLITRRVLNPLTASRLRVLVYRRAASVVTISQAVANVVIQGITALPYCVIPDCHAELPTDIDNVAAIRARFPNKKLIGHVGALDRTKGQQTIIEVASRAIETRPNWQFLLLGTGPDEKALRQATSKLGNVELTGFVANVGDYLAAFDLFVFPSLKEGLGSTLLDAMHLGLPIVATKVGGIPELICDEDNGYLIPPNNAAALENSIEKLLNDPQRYRSVQAANRAKADHYSPTRMADRYEALYQNILKTR